ncbi:MAG: hypothetical protein GY862_19595 [Gammaproteobacteria bacterium]|nr:hypothetical protein [Gammaproteobacteria bacterium]
MAGFNWLHLTDFHQGIRPDWLWPSVSEIFFDDLERLHELCGPWDLVLFTGDLTQSGNAEEFQKVDEKLDQLWDLFKILGSMPMLLAVPGNHDLVRPDKKNPAAKLLHMWDEDIQTEFWEDGESPYRQVVTHAFKNYTQWREHQPLHVKNINTGILPGDFSVTIGKEGAKLGIVGLNTSFLQLTGDDYNGRLALHARQFHAACDDDGVHWAKQHRACLLLTHHPPTWLNAEARQHLNAGITDHGRFAVHLCGHMHEASYQDIAEGGTETRRIWQGRSLFGLQSFEEDTRQRQYGYSAGRIELSENHGSLTFWPRESRLQGGQRVIVPDLSVGLINKLHTIPVRVKLLREYTRTQPVREEQPDLILENMTVPLSERVFKLRHKLSMGVRA